MAKKIENYNASYPAAFYEIGMVYSFYGNKSWDAAAYRAQNKNNTVDPYVMYAWQRMCEILTQNINIEDQVGTAELRAWI